MILYLILTMIMSHKQKKIIKNGTKKIYLCHETKPPLAINIFF